MKSPAKRLEPVQSAAMQTAPVRIPDSRVVTSQCGVGASASKVSAQRTSQVAPVSVLGSPFAGVQ